VRKKPKLAVKTRVYDFERILKKDLLLVRNLIGKYLAEKLLSNKQKRIFLGIIV